MVSFTNTPYSEAWKIGMKQEKLMEQIMSIENINELWDTDEVMQKMLKIVKNTQKSLKCKKLKNHIKVQKSAKKIKCLSLI